MSVAFTRLSHFLWGKKDHEKKPIPLSDFHPDTGSRIRQILIIIVPRRWMHVGWESDDSDGSDWSVGWLEPHAHEFQCETESDSSFAVLVPCYRRGIGKPEKSVKIRSLGASNLSG
uniref:Uncharacterized protein n=1 Tax=Ananas comosus var. bracteatus TaxID=296719 RepID=A0A6V7QQ79_ANACO|nr:unnamed protein product [Ananas comosus var. bracteatus]